MGGGFEFIGEALALDLINTDIVVRGKPLDLLDAPGALAAWWREAGARYPDAGLVEHDPLLTTDDLALSAAKALRGALRAVCEAVIDGRPVDDDALAVLNRILRAGYLALAIGADGVPRQVSGSHDAGADGLLLPVARSALALLTGNDLARLHRCANDRCVLLFLDTTKSATRRWCSVGCMNRARSSRRYRERKRAATAAEAMPRFASG